MSKFKVGDRVLVVGNTNPYHFMEVGKEYTVISLEGADIGYGDIQIDGYDRDGGFIRQSVCFDDVELIAESVTNTIQLNHQYTSKNGQKWECIAVRGDVAWLVGVYDDRPDGAAYMYKLNGSAVCLGTSPHVYDIKWEPVVEWVDTRGSWAKKGQPHPNHHPYNIRFPLIDGKPDFMQATVTPTSDS